MLALRKRRMAAAHPFLRGGFRPFFFGAATWAVIAIALWLCVLAGKINLPSRFEGVAWHRHEMLFGFVGAAVSGFLLTAIPNWTGRLPIAGKPLLSLFGVWAAARLAVLFSSLIGFWPAAILDVGLFVSLALLAAREVLASNNRNVPIVGLVLAFGYCGRRRLRWPAGLIPADLGWRGAIALMIIMISMIGGRIIPSFTRNWMVNAADPRQLPTQPQSLDLLVIASTALSLAVLAQLSRQPADRVHAHPRRRSPSAPPVALGRTSNGRRSVGAGTPSWLSLGADRAASARAVDCRIGPSAECRRARADGRRNDHDDPRGDEPCEPWPHGARTQSVAYDSAAYVCATFGAVLRVAASLGLGPYGAMLDIAGTFWALAFFLFLIVYRPVLWSPRIGEQR